MLRLRTETRPAHDRIEAVPFSTDILEGRLPRGLFAGQLACWLRVHEALERSLAASEDEAVQAVWRSSMARTSHLAADAAHHGQATVSGAASQATTAAVTWIESLAATDPRSLLGCLYVLEGSKMGGAILRRHLQDAYGCEPDHLTYFWASGPSPMPDFKAFKDRMESALPEAADHDRVVAAASTMFDHLTDVLIGLKASS